MSHEIWRLPRVLSYTGMSRSAFYSSVLSGLWTKPVRLSRRAVGWPAEEVQHLIKAIIAGSDANEMRQLVVDLERARVLLKGE